MVQVIKNGLPEDQAKVLAGSTPAGTDRSSSHHLSHPSMKRPYNGACLKQHPFIGADPIALFGSHRGARGRGGFGHRTQDRKYPNSHGPHQHPAPDQFYTPNPLVYPGPPQNPHLHPRITCHTSKGMASFLKQVIFTIKTSPHLSLQRSKIKTLGHPGKVLNGGVEWTLSSIQS